jgi:hypothetical protein
MAWYIRQEVAAYRNNYQTLHQREASLAEKETWSQLLSSTVVERKKIHDSIVSEESLPNFIEALEQTGRHMGVDLEIANAALRDASNPNIQIDFRVSASQEGVWRFVQALERLPYQLRINQASFSAVGSNEKASTWDAQFRIELLSIPTA